MVIPQATMEGFEPSPPPADWTDEKPAQAGGAGQAGGEPVRAGVRVVGKRGDECREHRGDCDAGDAPPAHPGEQDPDHAEAQAEKVMVYLTLAIAEAIAPLAPDTRHAGQPLERLRPAR